MHKPNVHAMFFLSRHFERMTHRVRYYAMCPDTKVIHDLVWCQGIEDRKYLIDVLHTGFLCYDGIKFLIVIHQTKPITIARCCPSDVLLCHLLVCWLMYDYTH